MRIFIGTCLMLVAVLGVNAQTNITRVPTLDGRIVGGVAVSISSHPYQLYFIVSVYACGASIIAPTFAVTAAHCTYGSAASTMTLRAGSSLKSTGGTVHTVAQKYEHPLYNPSTHEYDAALLRVTVAFVYGPNIQRIPLHTCCTFLIAGTLLTATGWGTTSEGGVTTDQLQKVDVPFVTQAACQPLYAEYGPNAITLRSLCAGYIAGGKDTCQGDSGGPIVYNGILVGITSWGKGCARPNYPGVYARVSALPIRQWLLDIARV